jgi:hypothetical protein
MIVNWLLNILADLAKQIIGGNNNNNNNNNNDNNNNKIKQLRTEAQLLRPHSNSWVK